MATTFGDRLPKQQQSTTPVLPVRELRTRHRFSMKVHPDQWEWDVPTSQWLPRISCYRHDPGVQGVGFDARNKRVDTSEADNHYRKKGYLIFDNGDRRLHECPELDEGEFMTRLRAGKGYAYVWVWEGFDKVGTTIIWAQDDAIKRGVQSYIAETQHLKMPALMKAQRMKKAEASIRRLSEASIQNKSPSLALRLKAHETLLAAWQADYALEDVEAPKRNRKPRTKGARIPKDEAA